MELLPIPDWATHSQKCIITLTWKKLRWSTLSLATSDGGVTQTIWPSPHIIIFYIAWKKIRRMLAILSYTHQEIRPILIEILFIIIEPNFHEPFIIPFDGRTELVPVWSASRIFQMSNPRTWKVHHPTSEQPYLPYQIILPNNVVHAYILMNKQIKVINQSTIPISPRFHRNIQIQWR